MSAVGPADAEAARRTAGLRRPEQSWFSTDSVVPSRRVAAWEAHHAQSLVGLGADFQSASPLRGESATLQLSLLRLARVSGSPHAVHRRAQDIAASPVSGLIMYVPLQHSSSFTHRNGSADIGPGTSLICDGDTTFDRRFPRGIVEAVIFVPRELLRALTGTSSVRRPALIDLESDSELRTAGRELTTLAARALDQPLRRGERLEDRVIDLLGSLLQRPLSSASTVDEVFEIIADTHSDPTLSAARLAHFTGVSERQLSRIMAEAGTSVPRAVLEARLSTAYDVIADPARADASMAEIAVLSGFRSQAQFSRAYRSRFGVSPAQHRKLLAASTSSGAQAPQSARR